MLRCPAHKQVRLEDAGAWPAAPQPDAETDHGGQKKELRDADSDHRDGVLALVLLYVGYTRGGGQHVSGVKLALTTTGQILPLLVCASIVAGMVQVLLPRELLSRWLGAEAGMRGILIGTLAGGLTPGGPYVSLPIAAGLMRAGAGVGTMVAFLTAWSLWGVSRLPMEVGILGWKLALIRLGATFFFPPIAGLIAQTFFPGTRSP